jgi:prepilin-type processing-associated H-X9-DG protein
LTGVFRWGHYSFGNYPAFFGGIDAGTAYPTSANYHQTRGAFGFNFGARAKDFVDGTSKSMIFGEYLRSTGSTGSNGRTNDQRGMLWQGDEPGGGIIMAAISPNSTTSDVFYPDSWCPPSTPTYFPCTIGSTDGLDHTAGARSLHPGGVNVAYADGSARFTPESVSLNTWMKLVSIADGEVVDAP